MLEERLQLILLTPRLFEAVQCLYKVEILRCTYMLAGKLYTLATALATWSPLDRAVHRYWLRIKCTGISRSSERTSSCLVVRIQADESSVLEELVLIPC